MIGIPLAALAAAPYLLVASTGSLPTIDVKSLCLRGATVLSQGSVVDTARACEQDEMAARDQMLKDWATYSASDKGFCIQPSSYLPSYVEWLTCLETSRDVANMRKQPQTAQDQGTTGGAQKNRHRSKNAVSQNIDRCPTVYWRVDGTIASVDASC
jgi:hypothetical protein